VTAAFWGYHWNRRGPWKRYVVNATGPLPFVNEDLVKQVTLDEELHLFRNLPTSFNQKFKIVEPKLNRPWEIRHRCTGHFRGEADLIDDEEWGAGTETAYTHDHVNVTFHIGNKPMYTLVTENGYTFHQEEKFTAFILNATGDTVGHLHGQEQPTLDSFGGRVFFALHLKSAAGKPLATAFKQTTTEHFGREDINWKIHIHEEDLHASQIVPVLPILIASKFTFSSFQSVHFLKTRHTDMCNALVDTCEWLSPLLLSVALILGCILCYWGFCCQDRSSRLPRYIEMHRLNGTATADRLKKLSTQDAAKVIETTPSGDFAADHEPLISSLVSQTETEFQSKLSAFIAEHKLSGELETKLRKISAEDASNVMKNTRRNASPKEIKDLIESQDQGFLGRFCS